MNGFKEKLQKDYQEYRERAEKVKYIKVKAIPNYYKMFDKNGEYVGCINTKYEKIQNKYLKGVSTFVVTKDGKVILELRSKDCNLAPEQRDLCSGHIDKEEESDKAVYRELKEELGIAKEQIHSFSKNKEAIPLVFGNDRKFFIQFHTVIGDFSAKQIKFNVQKEEVADIIEISMEDCFELIRSSKTKFPYEGNEEKFEQVFQSVKKDYENFKKERSIEGR